MEEDKDFPGVERFSVKDAIDKVKKEAITDIDIIEYMADLSIRQKLLLAYFYGTRKGKPTILSFEEPATLTLEVEKIRDNENPLIPMG